MDDKTVAPFALPPTEQVFGQPSPSEPAPAAEPQKRRRGRPAKQEGTPKTKRQGRRSAAPVNWEPDGFTIEQVAVLRGLSDQAFGVVAAIMKQVPQAEWSSISDALNRLAPK